MTHDNLAQLPPAEICYRILAGKEISGVRFGYHLSVIVDGLHKGFSNTVKGESFVTLAGPWVLSKANGVDNCPKATSSPGLSAADQLMQISQVAEKLILSVEVSADSCDLLIHIEDGWLLTASGDGDEGWHVGLRDQFSLSVRERVITSLDLCLPGDDA